MPASTRWRPLALLLPALAALPALSCEAPELCPPQQWRANFLSTGDCVFTRAEAFGGHEWLTDFANQDLRERGEPSFVPEEIRAIIEGNRRVDFPQELLVNLSHSVVAYASALAEYHDLPENQPKHFLLDARNNSRQAAEAAHALMHQLSEDAVDQWEEDRLRSLTLMGQACHTLQDAYSPAHARRDMGDERHCVLKVKAYLERAPGFLTDDIEFHGGTEDDTVGHITPDDSIFREGRDCRDPDGRAAVSACLSEHARLARDATADYLGMMSRLVRTDATPDEVTDAVEAYIGRHLSLCD